MSERSRKPKPKRKRKTQSKTEELLDRAALRQARLREELQKQALLLEVKRGKPNYVV
jgi:hypothetical protein